MMRKFLLMAAAFIGIITAAFICTLTIGPVIPAFTYSVSADSSLQEGVGIMILAPKGGHVWQKTVEAAVKELGDSMPVEIAFGSGDPISIHVAVEKLKMRGAERIAIIPLYLSSHSSFMHQTRYILGLETIPVSMTNFVHPIPIDVPFALSKAMDDNPLVAGVLEDRAQAMSTKPSAETVVFVAESVGSAQDDALLRTDLNKLAGRTKSEAGYQNAVPVIMAKDDPFSRGASNELRKTVESAGSKGRVIVVPLMLDRNGLDKRIDFELKGLNYKLNDDCLLPHPKMIQWIKESIDKQLIKLNWERFAGDGVVMST